MSCCFAPRARMTSDMNEKGLNYYGKVENVQLTIDDWDSRWEQNLIGFHLPAVNAYLQKYAHLLLGENNRVFLPLCGKTKDLVYFADQGHDVYGCEFVEMSVIDFFSENSLEYSCEEKQLSCGMFKVYQAASKPITIYQGDFFALTSLDVGKFNAIWDRASLEAIDPSKRLDYAKVIIDLLSSNGKYLTSTLTLTGVQYTGPPYSISPEEIKDLFGRVCEIKLLETKEESGDAKVLKVASKIKHIHLLNFFEHLQIK